MPDPCFVYACSIGYKSNNEKIRKFKAPKDKNLREQWERKISRKDRRLRENDYVCAKHFRKEDILDCWTSTGPNGDVVEVRYYICNIVVFNLIVNYLYFFYIKII